MPRLHCFIGPNAADHFGQIRGDQKTGGALLEFSERTAMHGKSRVLSAIKYDSFKLDDSGNCIIKVDSHDPIFLSNFSSAHFLRQQLDV